jgi:hypothetical protein
MNNVDYDKTKFDVDSHGNLSRKVDSIDYLGYKIDVDGIGRKRVWDADDNFVGDFPNIQSAKEYIDCLVTK